MTRFEWNPIQFALSMPELGADADNPVSLDV